MLNKKFLYVSAASVAMIMATPALAQSTTGPVTQPATTTNVDEIIVTAERRSERLEDVPASVSALGSARLNELGVTGVADLGRTVPSLTISKTGAFTQPTIRGVGNTIVSTGVENNVALYVDGFYEPSSIAAATELNNIQQVEILKGPQGTLFGRNATGGAMLVTTRDPSFKPGADLSATVATRSDFRESFYGTIGLGDKVAVDLAAYNRASDGYTHDLLTGDPTSKIRNTAVRTKLMFVPTDTLKITLSLLGTHTEDASGLALTALNGNTIARAIDPTAQIASEPHTTSLNFPPKVDVRTYSAHLKVEDDLGWATLSSLSSYSHETDKFATDLDGSYLHIFEVTKWDQTRDTEFQEFNLSHSSDRLNLLGGVFLYHSETDLPTFLVAGNNIQIINTKDTAGAVYVDGTYNIDSKWFLTVGGRYSLERFQIHGGPAPLEDAKNFGAFTPRAALRYEISPSQNVYASFSQGFKSGFFTNGNGHVPVQPEKITAYEVGYKIATPYVRFNLAGYYYDYSNLQVDVFDLVNGGVTRTLNAASSTIKGIEGDLVVTPNKFVTLNASGGYIDAKYDSFPNAVNYVPNAAGAGNVSVNYDASGQPLIRTPKWSGNVGVDLHPPVPVGSLTLSGNLYYSSAVNYIFSGRISQPSYALLGLRATWTDPKERYSVAVFADNVANKNYIQGIFVNGLGDFVYWGPSRVVGVTVGAKF